LLIAYLNLDEVIKIIRKEEKPKQVLMKRFKLSEVQTDAILDTKLRHLAKLEEMQIKQEEKDLVQEQEEIEKILGSGARLKKLIRTELLADKEKFGDERRSPIVQRQEAQAMSETEIMPTEPVTVVLSSKGWVRAAKGHDVDPTTLSYKSGDEFLSAAYGRSNQLAVFFDTTGRAYSLAAHTLPSARGQGEPLSGRLQPPPTAQFCGVVIGEPTQNYLLGSEAGYGFIVKLEDLYGKNRNGKTVLNLPNGAKPLQPLLVRDEEKDFLVAVTNIGRMLIFPLKELPHLIKGKGNKIIGIPSKKVLDREEFMVQMILLQEKELLVLCSNNKRLSLKPSDWKHYLGERGRRGNKLPRAYQKLTGLKVETSA